MLLYYSIFPKISAENMKKLLSKVAHNQPKTFFSVLPTSPKSAQISNCDFYIMTLPASFDLTSGDRPE